MVKEVLCLFEEWIHAVPLCRKSTEDKKKKIRVRHGSSAMNFVTEGICDTWVAVVSSECRHHGIRLAVLGFVSCSDTEEGFAGLCSECSVQIDTYSSPPAKQVCVLYLELYKWFYGNN